MEYEIKDVKILGEKVVLKYSLNNQEKEIEVLLKTYTEFPFYSFKKVDEKEFKAMLKLNEKNEIYEEVFFVRFPRALRNEVLSLMPQSWHLERRKENSP